MSTISIIRLEKIRLQAFAPTLLVLLAVTPTRADDDLAAFARDISLKRATVSTDQRGIVISNETVEAHRQSGHLTTCDNPAVKDPTADQNWQKASEKRRQTAAKKRAFWQKQYRKQERVVAKARTRLAKIDRTIESLDRDHFNAGNTGRREATLRRRLDKARAERPEAVECLEREEQTLSAIMRDARNDGAEAEWFR